MSKTTAEKLPSRWDTNASFWVQIIREHRDKYRTELTDPAVLEAIGPADRLRVLDAGCGEGYMSRTFARAGAVVTGIDFSAGLVEAARTKALADGLDANFDVGSVYDLPYADSIFDLILCNHVINDLEEPAQPISEFGRVLKIGGRLLILMLHPCFYNKHAERGQGTNGVIASSYFDLRNIEQRFVVDGITSPAANIAWFRPLEYYTEQLRNSGFVILSLTEPHPTADQMNADPWWRTGFTRPLFMLIVAAKRSMV